LGTWRNNGCCEHPENEENEDVVQSIEDVDSDNTIDISTTITISQTATSAGGAGGAGGDGGEGGDANGGAGGAGGDATSLNYASVEVDNVVIINSNVDGNGQYPAYTIGTGNRKLEIRVDENGEAFVNGTKMDEQTLGDGTKVLIFRDSKVQNS